MGMGTKADAQWGFLKNIVNIDTFFSSGAISGGSSESSKETVKEVKEAPKEDVKPVKKSIER